MKLQFLTSFFFVLFVTSVTAQKNSYPINLIPENLKVGVNTVIREQKEAVEISSISRMNIKTYKAVTVFNKSGLSNLEVYEHYDKSRNIKSIEATIYNQFGFELKKIRRKDYIDQSVAGGAADISDSRVLYLNYTPTEYPFTIVYESEVETENTAFIPKWYPINDFEESVQKSEFAITYPENLGFKYKEMYFDNNVMFQKNNTPNKLIFTAENLEPKKYEELSDFEFPYMIFALDKFSLEGVEGSAKTWKEFGKWRYVSLLNGTDELPEEAISIIKNLTKNINDPIEKAKIVYQYMQDKTRYVSIQLGIGGWKPMLAKNVDRLGYGDCKALSNYTRALLKVIGVESYYTVIYGGREKKDMIEDFVSMQGNHIILSIPKGDKYIHLECTSQTEPFGFLGDFTDDRLSLVVKPDGGEIVRTTSYVNEQNSQITTGKVLMDDNGDLSSNLEIKYKGIQYTQVAREETLTQEKLKESLKGRYSNLTKLEILDSKIKNDKKGIEFTESLKMSVLDFVKKNGDEWIFSPNVFNANGFTPKRYRSRKTGFEIPKGFYDEDTIEIEIPANKQVSLKPEKVEIENKYGKYIAETTAIGSNKIKYTRKLWIKKGSYNKEEYEQYRLFREEIAKQDNSKVIIK